MATAPLFRIRTSWTGLAGGAALTTTFFEEATFSAQQTIQKMADFWDALAPQIQSDANWTVEGDVDIVDPVSGNIVSVEGADSVTGSGTDLSQLLSAGTQGLLNLRTGEYVGGRELRGKLYVPGPAVDHVTDAVPNATYNNALVAAYDTFNTGNVQPPVVYSRTHGQWQFTTSVTPSNYFARLTTRQR